MRKSGFQVFSIVVLVAVFTVFAAAGAGLAVDKSVADKASAYDSQKAKAGAVQKKGLKRSEERRVGKEC